MTVFPRTLLWRTFLLIAVVFLILMFVYPHNAIFLFFTFYVISGLAGVLFRTFSLLTRHK